MLKGIVKPNGEIVSMDEIVGRQMDAAVRCFEAGFICGVNENDAMIICQDGREVAVTIQALAPKKQQGGNGEMPADEIKQPAEPSAPQPAEPPAQQPAEPQAPQPAEPQAPQPAEPSKRPSRKQARLDAKS